MRSMLRVSLLFVAFFSAYSLAYALDLDGRWTIDWKNGTKNTIDITAKSEKFTGNYTNDQGNKCLADGTQTNESMTLFVKCSYWTVKCEGSLTKSGRIEGKYATDHGETGPFEMWRSR